jgi:hypothetical protein
MEAFVAALDADVVECSAFYQVVAAIHASAAHHPIASEALLAAFGLHLERSHAIGANGQFPHLGDVEAAHIPHWQQAIGLTTEPILQARLGDLIWMRRAAPRPDQAARTAIMRISRSPIGGRALKR